MARLGDYIQIKKGSKIEQTDCKTDSIRFIQIDDLRNDKNVKYCNPKKNYTIVDENDVLLAWDGANAGTIGYGKSGAIGSTLSKISFDHNILYPAYIGLVLESNNKYLRNHCTGATIPHINRRSLEQIVFDIPRIDVQKRITKTIETTSQIIELRKQQIESLDLLVKSQFIEMFGSLEINDYKWPELKLSEACATPDDIKCGPFGTQLSKAEYVTSGVALWGIPQINSSFAKQPSDYLTPQKAKQLEAFSLIPGDIAMSRKGNVGMCALFPDTYPAGIIHSDVLRIRTDRSKFNPTFLMYQLHISPVVESQIGMVSSGAVMTGINVTKLKNIFIHKPPIEIQNQFAAFVQQVDKSKFAMNQSLEKLEQCRNALMQEAFG